MEIRDGNEDILAVYMMTRRQYVTAEQGRVADISLPAVKMVMDLIGIKDQARCMMLVQRLFHELYRHPESR